MKLAELTATILYPITGPLFGANWVGLFAAVGTINNAVNKGRRDGLMCGLFVHN